MSKHNIEVLENNRFQFGKNWSLFFKLVNEERILEAQKSLLTMLNVENLHGKKFLDIGCGSGLFSLAASRLGAEVFSFDYDPESVACTRMMKRKFSLENQSWIIEEGSILDNDYMASIGNYDIVYSWGVLHHTGSMWKAIENATMCLSKKGMIYIAIYNDQKNLSIYWRSVKRIYNKSPRLIKLFISAIYYVYFFTLLLVADLVRRRNFLDRLKGSKRRGMSLYRDVVDWVGGYPFEVSTPEKILSFFVDKGLVMTNLKTVQGKHGCNEFVFEKKI